MDETGIEQAAAEDHSEVVNDGSTMDINENNLNPPKTTIKVEPRKRLRVTRMEQSYSEEPPESQQVKRFKRSKPRSEQVIKIEVTEAASPVSNIQCSICSKVFSRKSALQRHIESIHENKKNFTCSRCFKAFTRKESLENHKCVPGSSSKASPRVKQEETNGKASKGNEDMASGSDKAKIDQTSVDTEDANSKDE
jgi:uncharacterized Zn-finger protein